MARIVAWEDDPLTAKGAAPIPRPAPPTTLPAFAVAVRGRQPAADKYPRGSSEFRFWSGLDALSRASRYWAVSAAPVRQWQPGRVLPITMDLGEDLNAYYDREGLNFFHAAVRGVTVFSGESPDVLCHEHGHAVLDAVKPELWNAASLEVDALHEAFGDIAAMLSALQLASVRTAVLDETAGRLSRSSRLSRLAEQLGWAIRQYRPDAAEPDCLRNAVNSFFYREPATLPPSAPSSQLASESHSFSRVFTAAWLESFAAMVERAGATSTGVKTAARDAGVLLVTAIREARIATNYFAQVAAHLLRVDARLFGGRDQEGIRAAFVKRGILSVASASAVVKQLTPDGTMPEPGRAESTTATTRVAVDGALFGLRARAILVDAPVDSTRSVAASAARDLGSLPPVPAARAAESFVEVLLRRRRVDAGRFAIRRSPALREGRATHALVADGRHVRLVRRRFH
jgi:hypothetical protein